MGAHRFGAVGENRCLPAAACQSKGPADPLRRRSAAITRPRGMHCTMLVLQESAAAQIACLSRRRYSEGIHLLRHD